MAKRETFVPFVHVGPGSYATHDGRFTIVNVDGEGWTLAWSKDHGGEKIASGIASQDDCRKILESRKDRPENANEKAARERQERQSGSNVKASNTRATQRKTAEQYLEEQKERDHAERSKKKQQS